jgi:hypothetical protein
VERIRGSESVSKSHRSGIVVVNTAVPSPMDSSTMLKCNNVKNPSHKICQNKKIKNNYCWFESSILDTVPYLPEKITETLPGLLD